ncbi:ROK family protein [Streptomyces sp. DW26H14]|uniref:ROK family protein n=1 Tax=Streptomyces sp. DW26H14 TaxID=3435395 RepID=UPI00403D5F65
MTDGTTGAQATAADGPEFVLGIDIGGTKIALATAGPGGGILRTARLDTRARNGADQALDRALRAATRLRDATPGRLLGVGVAAPGVVHDDHVAYAPNIPGLADLALRDRVAAALGPAPVRVDNDVKAAGLAEARWGALRGSDPGLYLNLGTGLAAALVVGGRVLRGAHGAAGEIGYLLRERADQAGAASGRAPLEECFSGLGLARRAEDLLGGAWTASGLFAATDGRARALVDEALDTLAVQVANMATTLDPAVVAVGGGMTAVSDRILPALTRRLTEAVPYPPALVTARFATDAALVGALALAPARSGAA